MLREWREGDWAGLQRTYGDPEVMRWHGSPEGYDLERTAFAVGRMHGHWWQLGYGLFATEVRATGDLIGRIGLIRHPAWPLGEPKVEVAWTLQRSAWGRGYATEGAKASLAFAFDELCLAHVFSMTDEGNARSRAVMERCGLTYRGEVEMEGERYVYYQAERDAWPPPGVELPAVRVVRT